MEPYIKKSALVAEINMWAKSDGFHFEEFAKHFFELGLKTQKGE